MRFGISPIVPGEDVNDFMRRQPPTGAGDGNMQRNPVMGKHTGCGSVQALSSNTAAPRKRQ